MTSRGMTQNMVNSVVKNGKVLSQNNGNKFMYITNKGVAIVRKDGKLITTWSADYFDLNMKGIVKQLFGD